MLALVRERLAVGEDGETNALATSGDACPIQIGARADG